MPDGTTINNLQTDMTSIDRDMSEAVRATAMLADVTISVWGAERTDQSIMNRAKSDAGATGNVGRAIKNMLAGADKNLKTLKSAFFAVRTAHYALTLPWVSDPHAARLKGPRLLPNMLFERYLTEISAQKREATKALDAFIHDYDRDVARAKANLGKLADQDYPTADEVRRLFRIAIDFEPIPAGASFRGLPPHFAAKLAQNLRTRQEAMVAQAQAAVFEQVRERISHLSERLADADARFKSSTIESVRELVTLLPGWNVTNNPHVAEITRDIERMLTNVTPDDLRKDNGLRADVANQAAAVVGKLASWGL